MIGFVRFVVRAKTSLKERIEMTVGEMVEKIKRMLTNLEVEVLEPVVARGYPKEEDFRALDRLSDEILRRHKEQGI